MADVDRELVRRAIAKRQVGRELDREERRAVRRFEADREEATRWDYYRTISKKHWREMSGRQQKILDDQARSYGAPLLGPTVSLPAFVKWFHDFLATNHRKLLADDSADPLLAGAASPALEEYRRERTKLAKLDRLEREESLIDRDKMHGVLALVASRYREAGDRLQRDFGPEAHQIIEEAIDDASREIESLFSSRAADDAADESSASDDDGTQDAQ